VEQNRARRPSEKSGKLNEAKVALIREKLVAGVGDQDLAEEFGVAKSLIGKIRRGEVWKSQV
jgi:predicted transcriptional regulator